MFDFSFAELATIGAVALVVIGPERLPKVARTLGHLMGRAQRYVNDVKADIQREIELEDFHKIKQSVDDAAGELRASLQETENTIRNAGQAMQANLDDAVADAKRALGTGAQAAEPAALAHETATAAHEAVAHEAAPAESAVLAHDSAQAELPLADPAPAAVAQAAEPARPPANVTTGTPT